MENVLNRYYDKNGYLKVVLTPEGKDELQVAWNNGDMDFEVKCWYYINDEEYWVKNDFNFFGTIQYMVNCYVEDKDLECFYTVRGDGRLHEFATRNKFVYHCKAVQKLINLNTNENCVMFFSTYANTKIGQSLEIRAEIIGVKKNGFSVLLQSPETQHRVMFCMTFADNITIDQLDRKVFFKLVNHLQKATVILDPFLLWFRNIGNLIYTPSMEKQMNKNDFFLPFE